MNGHAPRRLSGRHGQFCGRPWHMILASWYWVIAAHHSEVALRGACRSRLVKEHLGRKIERVRCRCNSGRCIGVSQHKVESGLGHAMNQSLQEGIDASKGLLVH